MTDGDQRAVEMVTDKRGVIDDLLRHARENEADAVVVDVPREIVEAEGGVVAAEPDEHGRVVDSTLFAGPVARETDETIELRSPSRVGRERDFGDGIRQRLRADGVYGFRDGVLDGVELPKDDVEIYRS